MNTLGKILVFINLLFSLTVGALIIMVFIARTNWKNGYEDMSQRYVREQANLVAERDARRKEVAQKNDEIQAVSNDRDDAKKQLKLAADQRTEAVEGKKQVDAQLAEAQATSKKLQAMLENREVEVKNLDTRLKDTLDSNEKLVVANKTLTERAVTAEVQRDTFKMRNEGLVTQVQELLKEVQSARAGYAAKASTLERNPPPEDIKGSIKTADMANGLVTINLGSDNGLSKGNTLEVYRLRPSPQYVGVVRIMDVRPHEAVGKLVLRRGQVQVGDEVASEILSRR
jgi:uncharacterized protein YxeA